MVADHLFIVFGESINDGLAIKNLIYAIAAGKSTISVEIRRNPVVLSRGAHRKKHDVSRLIASDWKTQKQRSKGKVTVVAHRDCDAVEPAHVAESKTLRDEIRSAGVEDVIAATPAWELETWWMLFPEAIARTRRCWRKVNYGSKTVGSISHSKEHLTRDLRPVAKHEKSKCADYTEADSVTISKHILELKLVASMRTARSASFDVFCEAIEKALTGTN